jgi:hypothetical protein
LTFSWGKGTWKKGLGIKISGRAKWKGDGITELDLRSGIRSKKTSKARRLFCQLAVRKMDHSGGEVARLLGVAT